MAKPHCDDEKVVKDKDAFKDEADEHDETEEDVKVEMDIGEKEEDPYSEEGREKLEEDDEAKPGELGYAKGSAGGRRHESSNPKPVGKQRFKPKR